MSIYNLIRYSKKYSKTTASFWNYYIDEPNSGALGDKNCCIRGSESFDYKTSVIRRLEGNNTVKEVKIVVPLTLIWVELVLKWGGGKINPSL